MDRNPDLMDERSRRVRLHALVQGGHAFLAHHTGTKRAENVPFEPKPGYLLAAEALLLAHPEYLDEERQYFNWYAQWYSTGYELKEEHTLNSTREYLRWR